MERDRDEAERERVERELRERATEKERQWRGSTPPEDVLERALEVEPAEPGVERHAGEDPGVASDPERDAP
jgi:hypothetical protein